MLSHAAASTLAGILAGCGGGGDGDAGGYHPPPEPAGITYDVIPLTLGGRPGHGYVSPKGINADGKVAGRLEAKDGTEHLVRQMKAPGITSAAFAVNAGGQAGPSRPVIEAAPGAQFPAANRPGRARKTRLPGRVACMHMF
jgi:hypothetical protein